MTREGNRIPSLDGLRIAVVMVLFSHLLGTQGFLRPSEGTFLFESVGDAIATGCLLAGTHESLLTQPFYKRVLESKFFVAVPYHTGVVGRILNSSPLVFVGVISYSLYLWQQLFLNRQFTSTITRFPENIVFVAAAAMASYYLVEQPCLSVRQHLEKIVVAKRPKPATVPASPEVSLDGIGVAQLTKLRWSCL